MVQHSSLHVRQKQESSNDHQNNRKPQLPRQPVLLCILIGCSCIFQGLCTLISISTEEPQATKATVHITKAKHLSQPSIIQVQVLIEALFGADCVCLADSKGLKCLFKAASEHCGNCGCPTNLQHEYLVFVGFQHTHEQTQHNLYEKERNNRKTLSEDFFSWQSKLPNSQYNIQF